VYISSSAFVDTWNYSEVRQQAVNPRLVLYCISFNHWQHSHVLQVLVLPTVDCLYPSTGLTSGFSDCFRISFAYCIWYWFNVLLFFSSMSYCTLNWLICWRRVIYLRIIILSTVATALSRPSLLSFCECVVAVVVFTARPHCASLAVQTAVIARGYLSVCPSVTFRCFVHTNKHYDCAVFDSK